MSRSSKRTHGRGRPGRARARHHRLLAPALVTIAVEAAVMRLRGYPVGRDVVVRCRSGHLFTTTWIPGASLKSIRLGWWRFQYCPVGRHWSLVKPVKDAELTAEERRTALEHRDVRVP
jgi:hypothetical protein